MVVGNMSFISKVPQNPVVVLKEVQLLSSSENVMSQRDLQSIYPTLIVKQAKQSQKEL